MATDKRLDQVSTLTDFDYALIVKGDQVAKASKKQLAELVGNLLYGATNASSLATVVAGLTHTNGFKKDVFSLNPSNSKSFEYNERGGLMILRTGINSSIGLYLLNFGSGYSAIKETPGADSYFTIAADNGKITITNIYTGPVGMSIMIVNLD